MFFVYKGIAPRQMLKARANEKLPYVYVGTLFGSEPGGAGQGWPLPLAPLFPLQTHPGSVRREGGLGEGGELPQSGDLPL